jgi:hypothetical protein
MLRPAGSFECRRELGADLSGVPVSELVKDPAMLVEQAMVGVDEFEKTVAAVEVLPRAIARLRIKVADPRIGTVARAAPSLELSRTSSEYSPGRTPAGIQRSTQKAWAFCPVMRFSGSGSRERYGVRIGTSASGT